jgi:hypothetical protein
MIRARCDEKFETASQQFEKARTDLMVVTATCINEAAQDLAHACGKFANRDAPCAAASTSTSCGTSSHERR